LPKRQDGAVANPERIVEVSQRVASVAGRKIAEINGVTTNVKMLALNALIEASRAGEMGRGFAVVANEVKSVATDISRIAQELEFELAGSATELTELGRSLVENVRGTRLADLSLHMIEVIDRNLYERSCDVRWWATDSAVVDCVASPTPAATSHCIRRLAVILKSYTVYLDLWVIDADGRVVANGQPDRYRDALGGNVAAEPWFREALATPSGNEFVVANVQRNALLGNAAVATYATAIREGGAEHGRVLGVLGIFFDWEPQARAVVEGVRLGDEERKSARALILDANHRVLASSDGRGILSEVFTLPREARGTGHVRSVDGSVVGFALTPGYETYRGLGWFGAIIMR
jgi:hypothetical protein